jgi:hypothetical protein
MEKEKLLSVVRFWLIGTFVIVLAATTTYVTLFNHTSLIAAFGASLPIWGITGILCIVWYMIYRVYLNRKY